jgi:hypothetical protein
MLEQWNNGKWGYWKIPLDRGFNNGITFFIITTFQHSIIPCPRKNVSLNSYLFIPLIAG